MDTIIPFQNWKGCRERCIPPKGKYAGKAQEKKEEGVTSIWDGFRSGYTFWKFFFRFVLIFTIYKTYDMICFDYFLLMMREILMARNVMLSVRKTDSRRKRFFIFSVVGIFFRPIRGILCCADRLQKIQMQRYGSHYIPWHRNISLSRLFGVL